MPITTTDNMNNNNNINYQLWITLPLFSRCPIDETVKFLAAPSPSAQRFRLEAFKFIAYHPLVFVHCHVIICNATDPTSQCAKPCPIRDRKKRSEDRHMIDDVYSVSQGPLRLAGEKREDTNSNALDKRSK